MVHFNLKIGISIFVTGVVTLLNDYEVCREGSVLSPSQAKILELLDYKLACFKLVLKGRWTKGEGFEKVDEENSDDDESDMETTENGK